MELNKFSDDKTWRSIFLLSIGITMASAFAMKWMESAFLIKGKLFTIIGLELYYTQAEIQLIVTNLDEGVRTLLINHLVYDFVFMAGVYPAIASLCMIVRNRISGSNKQTILTVFASAQILAWTADIFENIYLIKWVNQRNVNDLYDHFHFIVWAKWMIAVGGIIVAGISFLFYRKKKPIFNS